MIVDLPATTTSKVSKALVKIREEGGAVALGRVLTLVIATHLGQEEEAIEAVSRSIRRARAGIKDPKRPTGSFIFIALPQ